MDHPSVYSGRGAMGLKCVSVLKFIIEGYCMLSLFCVTQSLKIKYAHHHKLLFVGPETTTAGTLYGYGLRLHHYINTINHQFLTERSVITRPI